MKNIFMIALGFVLMGPLSHALAEPTNDLQGSLALAGKGDANAQGRVGAMYYLGEGTSEDIAEAAKWFRKAADNGLVEAQVVMAALSDIGQGVSQDYTAATNWYEKAAGQGHEPSRGILNYYKNQALRATKALQIAKQYARALLKK